MPHVVDGKIDIAELTDARIDEAESAVAAVVSEAQGIREALSKWGFKLPYPLTATNRRWALHPKHLRADTSYDDGFVFRSTTGRHISFWNYRSTISVGYSGKYASYYQNVHIEPDGEGVKRVYTQMYWMAFLGEGMTALARYLNMQGASMPELALAIANRMYTSGQFSPQHLMKPPQIYYDSHYYDMVPDEERWAFPDSLRPLKGNVDFCLAKEKHADGTFIPLTVNLGSDRIIIGILRRDDRSQHFMPLSSDLLPFWEGAKLLAKADPDDNGYLARVI